MELFSTFILPIFLSALYEGLHGVYQLAIFGHTPKIKLSDSLV